MTGSLTERYDDRIAGVLSCYDRVVVTGTLPTVCYAARIRSFSTRSGFASSITRSLPRRCATACASGRHRWQRASGYNWRALVEADIGRYKRVIGDALRSRTGGRQTTEVAIAVATLNRMLELGRPEYVRLP